jgi:choline dehydrogenase
MSYDIIVIGGGSAGGPMAARLTEDRSLNVLLLEAGGSDRHLFTRLPAANIKAVQNPAFDWCYQAEPDPTIGGRADVWAAGKRLGGGSAINGMMFIRGHRWDYDHWSELGAKGWDYEGVLPYFKRMERNERGADDHRGDAGPLSVSEVRARYPLTDAWIEAATEAGVPRSPDLNGACAEGVDFVQVSQKSGWRASTAAAYIRPAQERQNLRVELEARVLKIRIEQGRAVGVEYEQGGQKRYAAADRGVVLAAGAMNSPRMLMLSGIGPAGHLKEMGITVHVDLPGVGRNLQEHVGVHLVNDVNKTTLNSDLGPVRAAMHALDFVTRGRGALTTPIGHAQAFVHTRPGPAPNLQLAFAPLAFDFDDKGRIVLRAKPSVSTLVGVMRPQARGIITLRSPDPYAPPVISHRLLDSDDDLDQLAEGLALARRIVAAPAFARYITDEVRPGAALDSHEALKAFARMAAFPMYHPVGTCKIGQDEMAVVDPNLAVRGVSGLWVCDASVMPSLPQGNTNATSIMIGEKGSDLVKAALGNRAAA